MDGYHLETLSRVLSSACADSTATTTDFAVWIKDPRHSGTRTATEVSWLGNAVLRRLCKPEDLDLGVCPATIFTDSNLWCPGCNVGELRVAVEDFDKGRQR